MYPKVSLINKYKSILIVFERDLNNPLNEGFIILATTALTASVIGAFYYIRFIKVMFFDEVDSIKKIPVSRSLGFINIFCFIFIIAFIIIYSISPLSSIIGKAALALN